MKKRTLITLIAFAAIIALTGTFLTVLALTQADAPALETNASAPEADVKIPEFSESGVYRLTEKDGEGSLEELAKRTQVLLEEYDQIIIPAVSYDGHTEKLGQFGDFEIARAAFEKGEPYAADAYCYQHAGLYEVNEKGEYVVNTDTESVSGLIFCSLLDYNPGRYVHGFVAFFHNPEAYYSLNRETGYHLFMTDDASKYGYESYTEYYLATHKLNEKLRLYEPNEEMDKYDPYSISIYLYHPWSDDSSGHFLTLINPDPAVYKKDGTRYGIWITKPKE